MICRPAQFHIFEVNEHALRSFGTQVHICSSAFDWASLCLEHEVEGTRFGEGARFATRGTGVRVFKLIFSVPSFAFCAIDERVTEVFEMTRRFPDLRWAQDGRV